MDVDVMLADCMSHRPNSYFVTFIIAAENLQTSLLRRITDGLAFCCRL